MLQKDLRSSKVPSIFASHLRGNAANKKAKIKWCGSSVG